MVTIRCGSGQPAACGSARGRGRSYALVPQNSSLRAIIQAWPSSFVSSHRAQPSGDDDHARAFAASRGRDEARTLLRIGPSRTRERGRVAPSRSSGPSQIRTCGFPASGSSSLGFATRARAASHGPLARCLHFAVCVSAAHARLATGCTALGRTGLSRWVAFTGFRVSPSTPPPSPSCLGALNKIHR
jgi:hypothetical protein